MSRQAVLVLLAVTLFGVLSGLSATLIQPERYQAEAYVVVYAMPSGFTSLVSPSEATKVNQVYQAGALQDAVIQEAQKQLPNYTADDFAHSIDVAVVAYTPLTRITATATTAAGAAQLANAVANAWVHVAGQTYAQAYDSTKASLQAREDDLTQQIATTQQSLEAADPSSATAIELQTKLQTLQNTLSETEKSLVRLDQTKFDVAGDAWMAIPAKASNAVRSPNLLKNLAVGATVGIAVGIILALWLVSRRWKREADHSQTRMVSLAPAAMAHEAANGR